MHLIKSSCSITLIVLLLSALVPKALAQTTLAPVDIYATSKVDPQNPNMVQISMDITNMNTGAPVTNGGGEVQITLTAPYPNGLYLTTCGYTVNPKSGKATCDYEDVSTAAQWATINFQGSGYQATTKTVQVSVYTQ